MKKQAPEQYRTTDNGRFPSDASYGMNGAFRFERKGVVFFIIASDRLGWEHVSVSVYDKDVPRKSKRSPTWEEMCYVKSIFWHENETVIQFHPKSNEAVNYHQHCLHLWKKSDVDHELPDSLMVGPKGIAYE